MAIVGSGPAGLSCAGDLARAETSLNRAIGLAPDWVETGALVLPGQPPELPAELLAD